MTAEGSEVAVQDLIRLEPEYMVIHGRISGTTDIGLIFFIPYDRIIFVRFQKPVPDELVYGFYGLKPPEPKQVEVVPAEEAQAEEAPPAAPPAEETRHTPAGGMSRQELLERIRLRRHKAAGSKRPPTDAKVAPSEESGTTTPSPHLESLTDRPSAESRQ
jgi:hypothetical protein